MFFKNLYLKIPKFFLSHLNEYKENRPELKTYLEQYLEDLSTHP